VSDCDAMGSAGAGWNVSSKAREFSFGTAHTRVLARSSKQCNQGADFIERSADARGNKRTNGVQYWLGGEFLGFRAWDQSPIALAAAARAAAAEPAAVAALPAAPAVEAWTGTEAC
jgi:hypothetical protein